MSEHKHWWRLTTPTGDDAGAHCVSDADERPDDPASWCGNELDHEEIEHRVNAHDDMLAIATAIHNMLDVNETLYGILGAEIIDKIEAAIEAAQGDPNGRQNRSRY